MFQIGVVGGQKDVDEIQFDGQCVQGQYQCEGYQYQYGEQYQCCVFGYGVIGQGMVFGVFDVWVQLLVGVVVDDVVG